MSEREPDRAEIRECLAVVLDLPHDDWEGVCSDFARAAGCSADALASAVSIALRTVYKHTKQGRAAKRAIVEEYCKRELGKSLDQLRHEQKPWRTR